MPRHKPSEVEAVLDRFVEGWFLLILEKHQRHVSEMDLTMSQAQALRLLGGAPLSTGSLAARLGISAPAVSQLTDRLIRKQLIERRAAERDRRSVTVELSASGKRLVDGFRRKRNEVFEQALLQLSDSDRDGVIDALEKIASVLSPSTAEHIVSDKLKASSVKRAPARSAVQPLPTSQPPATSNEVGIRIIPRKRMRIEWD
jgi:DNA-binding MarR family transcriptional regulator